MGNVHALHLHLHCIASAFAFEFALVCADHTLWLTRTGMREKVAPVRALNEELCFAHRTGKSGRERDLWLVAADRRKARNGSAQCAKIQRKQWLSPTLCLAWLRLPPDLQYHEYATNR